MKKFINGALPQTSTRAYKKICEDYSLTHVALEVSQNAFEHGQAPLCRISHYLNENGIPCISFFNNGRPMTDKQFQNFVKEYHFHDISLSKPSSGGVFTSLKGYGLKDAVVFCSSDYGVSKVTFKNYHKDGHCTEWNWFICKENGDKGQYDSNIKSYPYDVVEQPSGFEVTISNSKQFTETELKTAQNNISKTFTTESLLLGRTIQLKWQGKNPSTIKLYDPMHFEQLYPLLKEGETIYNCKVGEYISDHIIWFVREDVFKGRNPKKK